MIFEYRDHLYYVDARINEYGEEKYQAWGYVNGEYVEGEWYTSLKKCRANMHMRIGRSISNTYPTWKKGPVTKASLFKMGFTPDGLKKVCSMLEDERRYRRND